MSHHTDHKSPDQIEHEVEEARARLRFTIDEIKEHMSPGRMLDQAIDYARASGGADFGRNLGRQVRDNPLPVALIGAGIGWLMTAGRMNTYDEGHLSGRRMSRGASEGGYDTGRSSGWGVGSAMHSAASGVGSVASGVGSAAHGVASGVGSAAHGVASGVGSVASGVGSAAHGVASGVGSAGRAVGSAAGSVASTLSSAASGIASAVSSAVGAIGGGASSAGNRASAMGHDMRDGLGHVREEVGHYGSAATDTAYDAMHRAGEMGTDMTNRVTRAIEDQPLILGAIGLAVGAILGAALPSTRMENRAFGSTADRIKDQASSMAREGMEQAKSVARDAVSEVSAAASELDRAGTQQGNGSGASSGAEATGENAPLRRAQNGTGGSHGLNSPLERERRDQTQTPS